MQTRFEKLEPLVERVIRAEERHKIDAALDKEVRLFLVNHGRALVRDLKRSAGAEGEDPVTDQNTNPPTEPTEPTTPEQPEPNSEPTPSEAPADAPADGGGSTDGGSSSDSSAS